MSEYIGGHRAGFRRRTAERFSSQQLSRDLRPRSSVGSGRISYGETPQQRQERLARLRQAYEESHAAASPEKLDLGNKNLPIYNHKAEILATIAEHKISRLEGPTGSGKTTQLAQYALEDGYDRVVYLMPRRVIVDNTSEYVEQNLRQQLGDDYPEYLVGKIHGRAVTAQSETRIQFLTSATFTKKYQEYSEQWRDQRVLIVSDEIHEANLETEFATALAATQVEANDGWRLVLSSATLDDDVTQEKYAEINGNPLPTISVEGRPHDIDIEEDASRDVAEAYVEYGVDSRKAIVFVEGVRSIKETIYNLKRANPNKTIRFYKLHSGISEAARREIFTAEPGPDESIVIVSTSAGQSGITIPKLDLVISNGLTKSKEIENEGAEGLPPRLCTQAELTQQAGRGGRDVDGATFVLARPVSYRNIYLPDELKQFHSSNSRQKHIPPEIYHTNIVRNVLAAIRLAGDFREFNPYLMHRVDNEATISESYELLYSLDAIDEDDKLTRIGEFMDDLPLPPELSRSLVEAIRNGASLREVLSLAAIAAAVSGGGFASWSGDKEAFNELIDPTVTDDIMTEYSAFLETREIYLKNGYSSGTDYLKHGVDPTKADEIHHLFDKICRRLGLQPYDTDMSMLNAEEQATIEKSLLRGFCNLIYKRVGSRRSGRQTVPQFQNIHTGEEGITSYEIGSRSRVKLGMARAALDYVMATPWWYDGSDGRHYSLNMVRPLSAEVVGAALTRMAQPQSTGCRVAPDGTLQEISQPKVGTIVVGGEQKRKIAAETDEQCAILKQYIVQRRRGRAVRGLLYLQEVGEIRNGMVSEILDAAVRGSHSANEVEGKLWGVVQEMLPPEKYTLFFEATRRAKD